MLDNSLDVGTEQFNLLLKHKYILLIDKYYMKISFSWQVLNEPLPSTTPLSSVLKVPIRKAIKEILPDESSLNTTVQPLNLDSPIIPLLIAYKIQQGDEFQIQAEVKVSTKNPLKLLQKRTQNKSHIYLLYKVMDMQAYERLLQLLIFIKYGKPQSKQLQNHIKQNNTQQFIKMLSSRETSIHSLFIYQKIKKQIIINEPVHISSKITENYILLNFSIPQEPTSELELLKAEKNQKKQVVISSVEVMNWLAALGVNYQQARNMRMEKHDEEFRLKPGEMYSVFFKVETAMKGCEMPFAVRWRWEGGEEVFEMLKYLKVGW